MAKPGSDWQELAAAASDLSRLTGIEITAYLSFERDVMCCKVAGNSVEITRKELEERSFVNLYDALKLAMTKAGLENPEQFLVKPGTSKPPELPPYGLTKAAIRERKLFDEAREPTATDIAMRQEFERLNQQKLIAMQQLTRKAIEDNQYKSEYQYLGLATLKNEGEPVAISLVELRNELLPGLQSVTGRPGRRASVPGFDAPFNVATPEPEPQVTWREPRETPELDLGEPSRAAEMAVLMNEPPSELLAPDLILEEGETHGTGKKVA